LGVERQSIAKDKGHGAEHLYFPLCEVERCGDVMKRNEVDGLF